MNESYIAGASRYNFYVTAIQFVFSNFQNETVLSNNS